ncbi:unnamed protein product [Caenorhabditis auriculariae]|uniref:Uncharacterized protein n=1 Tax=Caenorhabditis auriculariae TaxID=2777116 RepID=A0A8S1H7V1_9PELO|nr:unnamed protein product [Caenorhabditis auriculariae]
MGERKGTTEPIGRSPRYSDPTHQPSTSARRLFSRRAQIRQMGPTTCTRIAAKLGQEADRATRLPKNPITRRTRRRLLVLISESGWKTNGHKIWEEEEAERYWPSAAGYRRDTGSQTLPERRN